MLIDDSRCCRLKRDKPAEIMHNSLTTGLEVSGYRRGNSTSNNTNNCDDSSEANTSTDSANSRKSLNKSRQSSNSGTGTIKVSNKRIKYATINVSNRTNNTNSNNKEDNSSNNNNEVVCTPDLLGILNDNSTGNQPTAQQQKLQKQGIQIRSGVSRGGIPSNTSKTTEVSTSSANNTNEGNYQFSGNRKTIIHFYIVIRFELFFLGIQELNAYVQRYHLRHRPLNGLRLLLVLQ